MAETKHAVVRLDNMTGTKQPANLKSGKFYSSESPAVIDNAQVVVLGDKIDRELYKVTAPSATSVVTDLYLVATPELFYDETRTHYLTEWVNEADSNVRLYKMVPECDCFSATKEAFEGVPQKGKFVGFKQDSTKLIIQDAKDDKTFGKIVAVETDGFGDGKYEYFVIDVVTAGAAADAG